MDKKPVRIVASGTPGAHVHALINYGRIACYIPYTVSTDTNPVEMVDLGLTACSYCWPLGIKWPEVTA
jgi:hypothetical protein